MISPMRPLMLAAWALVLVPVTVHPQDNCGLREPEPGLLVSAEWLNRHRKDPGLIILQAERSRATYDSAHVAGARFIGVAEYTIRRGDLLTELPPIDQLRALLESLGVGDQGRIVLTGEILPVSRLFFTLDYLGLGERVSVLDGGLAAWRAAKGETTMALPPPPARATLTIHRRPELLADAEWVESHRGNPAVVLLDTRSREEYDGTKAEEGVSRPGHIPGAVNLDWAATVTDGRFRGKEELRELLAAQGATAGKELVTYCRVGSRASAVYFVARLLGLGVRLYDGSMNDWASRASLPVAGRP